jgi:cytochrome c oxidase subunit 3
MPNHVSHPDVDVERRPDSGGSSGNGAGSEPYDWDGHFGDGWQPQGWSAPAAAYRTGMRFALVSIAMLFATLSMVFLTRKAHARHWISTPIPALLYINTGLLLLSSVTLEWGRRALGQRRPDQFAPWIYATLVLGLSFVAGQFTAWSQLARHGVFLAANPSASFFYVITAAHAVHLFGGLLALSYLVIRARYLRWGLKRLTVVDVTATYWHFMGGLWVALLGLLVTMNI